MMQRLDFTKDQLQLAQKKLDADLTRCVDKLQNMSSDNVEKGIQNEEHRIRQVLEEANVNGKNFRDIRDIFFFCEFFLSLRCFFVEATWRIYRSKRDGFASTGTSQQDNFAAKFSLRSEATRRRSQQKIQRIKHRFPKVFRNRTRSLRN